MEKEGKSPARIPGVAQGVAGEIEGEQGQRGDRGCCRGKAELAFRTPRRFALRGAEEVPTGLGARARERRFSARDRAATQDAGETNLSRMDQGKTRRMEGETGTWPAGQLVVGSA